MVNANCLVEMYYYDIRKHMYVQHISGMHYGEKIVQYNFQTTDMH